jgi:hypothetical protein
VKLSFQGIRREIPDGLIHLFEVKKNWEGFYSKNTGCSNFLATVVLFQQFFLAAAVATFLPHELLFDFKQKTKFSFRRPAYLR